MKLYFISAIILLFLAPMAHAQFVELDESKPNNKELDTARRVMATTSPPGSIIGDYFRGVLRDAAVELKKDVALDNCSIIKNPALRAYCNQGEKACYLFESSSLMAEYKIPNWVGPFCQNELSLPSDSIFWKYYFTGNVSNFSGDAEVLHSALEFSGNMERRKIWVIYFANGYLPD